MRTKIDLLVDVGLATLVTTIGVFLPPLVALLLHIDETGRTESRTTEILGALTALAGVCVAAWWMFQRLQVRYSRPEARKISIAFALSAPISLGISLPLAQLPGGYADLWLGPHFALVGAVVGTFVMATLISFGFCEFALYISKLSHSEVASLPESTPPAPPPPADAPPANRD